MFPFGVRLCGLALVLAGAAAAQAPQVEWVAKAPALKTLPVTVGGRALVRAGGGASFGAKTYVYQWPGTHFDAAFVGPEVYLRLGKKNDQLLHVVVDRLPPAVLSRPQAGAYRVQGLGAGPHTVRVELVTENQVVPGEFLGFGVPVAERSLPVAVTGRQMEMIGDSHTLGYGNMSSKRVCAGEEVMQSTDVDHTGGVMAAQHYGAEYQVIAISGRGVVRNYNGSGGDPIPVAYPYVLENKKFVYKEKPGWHPQVVVIALGTNDFSSALGAGERWKSRDALHQDYEATYVRFVTSLRKRYPQAYFILWATDKLNGEIASEVSKVTATLNAAGETRVQFLPMPDLAMTACDWHPSQADNTLIYDRLVGFLDAHPQVWQGK